MTLSLPTINTPIEDLPEGYCRDCHSDQPVYLRLVGESLLWKCRTCGMWIHCVECGATKTNEHSCSSQLISIPILGK